MLRYLLAALVTAAAVAAAHPLEALLPEAIFLILFLAVSFSAWHGGLGPGILATVGSVVAVDYWFVSPRGSFALLDIEDVVRLTAFTALAGTASWLSEALRSARRQAEERAAESQRLYVQARAEIAARRTMQDSLRESEERFRLMAETVGAVLYVMQPSPLRVLYINPAFHKVWGRPPDAIYVDPWSFLESVHPDDRANCTAIGERRIAGEWLPMEYRILWPDGTERWIRDQAYPVRGADGRLHRVVGIAEDVTERKRAEEDRSRLTAIVESSSDAIIGVTLDGTITDWNAGAARLFGYPAGEAVGRPLCTLLALSLRADGVEILERVARGARFRPNRSFCRRKDGHTVVVSVAVSPIRLPGDRIIGASVIARDMTEQHRAEQVSRFLAESGAILASSLDFAETLGGVARLAVPFLADACAIFVTDPGTGAARPVACQHREPERQELLEALVAECWADHEASLVARSIRHSAPIFLPDAGRSAQDRSDAEREPCHLVTALGARSLIIVPMVARGRAIGAIALAMAGSARTHGPEDIAVAEELASRAALATDNALLFRDAQTEIVERRNAEQTRERVLSELATQRALLETVMQQMPAGIAIIEAPAGRLVLANRRLHEIWRQPDRSRLPWRSPGGVAGFHADGRPYESYEWPIARSLATGEVVAHEEIDIVRGDGSRATIRSSSAPVRAESGVIAGAVATYYDITDQKRKERALRLLAEAGATLGASLDHATTLGNLTRLVVSALADWCTVDLVAEDGTVSRVAASHRDPLKRELARALMRFPPDPATDLAITTVLRTGRSEVVARVAPDFLARIARNAEHLEYLRELAPNSYIVAPLIARGKVRGALTLVSSTPSPGFGPEDIALVEELAGRAALAVDNARLYRDANAANQAKADFLATMSHELRTPLTAIIGYTDLLLGGLSGPVTATQRQQLDRVRSSAWHLLRIIEEMLSFARLEAGHQEVRIEPVDLTALAREAAAMAAPLALEKRIEVHVEPAQPAITIRTDSQKLRQILVNLLTNGIKFTEHGHVRAAIHQANGSVTIRVSDTGIGIAPRHLERIFEPFWQVDQSATREVGGTGLGLSVSRRLAHLLGGELSVASEPGAGTTFTLTLPARPD